MDRDKIRYYLHSNKNKVMLICSLLFLVVIIVCGIFMFKKNNTYETFENDEDSTRYILADGIIGANTNGVVNLYSSKDGSLMDTISLSGEFILDTSDDFKNVYMLNVLNGEFYDLSIEDNKISNKKDIIAINDNQNIALFDYDNGLLVMLDDNKSEFIIKRSESTELERFNPSIDNEVDIFRIVNGNLVFSSGEYILSKNLSTNLSTITNLKIAQSSITLYDKENTYGEIVAQISKGDSVEVIEESDSGWYKMKYGQYEGYTPIASVALSDSETSSNDLTKIHIGEVTYFMHELGDKLFVHNGFGKDRGKSILLTLNPESLYIENVIKYEGKTNSLTSSIDDNKLYINEVMDSQGDDVRQMIKYRDISSIKDERLGFKYSSKNVLNYDTAYGMYGYIYYKESNVFNIYNLKSQQNDVSIKSNNEMFIPIYK